MPRDGDFLRWEGRRNDREFRRKATRLALIGIAGNLLSILGPFMVEGITLADKGEMIAGEPDCRAAFVEAALLLCPAFAVFAGGRVVEKASQRRLESLRRAYGLD